MLSGCMQSGKSKSGKIISYILGPIVYFVLLIHSLVTVVCHWIIFEKLSSLDRDFYFKGLAIRLDILKVCYTGVSLYQVFLHAFMKSKGNKLHFDTSKFL